MSEIIHILLDPAHVISEFVFEIIFFGGEVLILDHLLHRHDH